MNVAIGMLAGLLALAPHKHPRVLAVARPHAAHAQRAIVLDVHGPTEEAAALRATLQELTARRGPAFSFEAAGDAHPRATDPWATLSVELGDGQAGGGAALTLREGVAGRVRLHRVVPNGVSHTVAIEALATIAYTALETLSSEETREETREETTEQTKQDKQETRQDARPVERPITAPHQRAGSSSAREHAAPEQETAPEPSKDDPAGPPLPSVTSPPTAPPIVVPPLPDVPPPTVDSGGSLTISSRASAPTLAEDIATFPVRFSLASFAGYQAGNLFTGDRRPTSDAWGMGATAAGAVPRWPLRPALGLGLGAWYGTGREPSSGNSDGVPRPAAGARLQGQAEVRLTVLHQGRFSAAVGPWLTLARASYDFGPTQIGQRGPGPNQGPPTQGPDPNAIDGASRVTRTEVSAGLATRMEAELGGRLALYCTLAAATPLTTRPLPGEPRQQPGAPTGSGESSPYAATRWTLSAFAGLSIAITAGGGRFR